MASIRDRRYANWFWMNKTLIDDYGATIGPYGIAVYALLARCANENGLAIPSLRYMAQKLGTGMSTIQRYIDILVEEGLIERQRRMSDHGDFTSTEYVLLTIQDVVGGGVPATGTPVPVAGTPVPVENIPVYLQQVHGVPVENNEQEDLNKKDLEQENKPPFSPNGETSPRLTPTVLMGWYNEQTPETHPKVHRLSPGRRKKADEYLRLFPEPAFWHTVFAEIAQSAFLLGHKPSVGHEGFRADFDWLLTKGKADGTENCVKVAEGKYRDSPDRSPPNRMSEKGIRGMQAAQRIMEDIDHEERGQEGLLSSP